MKILHSNTQKKWVYVGWFYIVQDRNHGDAIMTCAAKITVPVNDEQ